MKKDKYSNLQYEQIILGECPIKAEKFEPADYLKLEEIKRSNEEILSAYDSATIIKAIEGKINGEKVINYKKILIPLSIAASLLLFFSIFTWNEKIVQTEPNNEQIRLKGNDSYFYVYRQIDSLTELLKTNSMVEENDLLQLSYVSGSMKYGMIFSIDGRGALTLHFPENVYSSTRLDSGGKVFLPYSYQLDNAPFFERFFFISSKSELNSQIILEKAGRIAQGNKSEMLDLDEKYSQQTQIFFKKEAE